ncbi:MAG TPA: ABC transporter permease [Streptosporangiaceae bacterium]|nr:ABC transporter permease [Streptosporangiaceae bacterium]
MKWYVVNRVGTSVLTLFLSSVVVFLGIRALPGGPAQALSSETASPQVLIAINKEYGLNKPIPVQYWVWISKVVRGNLGTSFTNGLSVSAELANRIPVTFELAVLSLIIAVLIGFPAGLLAAVRQNTVSDYAVTTVSLLGVSVPTFWLGLLLITVLAVHLSWLPASGFVSLVQDPLGNLEHMIMPAFVVGVGIAAVIMRQLRSAMLESLGTDYVRTARAKGLAEARIICIHALRNSLLTVVTVVGLQLGALISGLVITEEIFVIPGIGQLTLESVFNRDYPTLEGVVLLIAAGYIVVNFVVDLLYSVLNPRIRVTGGPS